MMTVCAPGFTANRRRIPRCTERDVLRVDGRRARGGKQQAHQSHKAAPEKLLGWLSEPKKAAAVGSIPVSFGDGTVVCDSYCIQGDDLESELEKWPSSMAALRLSNGRLRSRDASVYRAAVHAAPCWWRSG